MARSIAAIENQPIGLGIIDPNGGCFRYDEKYCQMVEMADRLAFQFTASQCGGDVVTNGNFSFSSSGWYSNDTSSMLNGWSYVSTQMNHVVGMTDFLQQNGILTVGKYYKLTFTINRVTNPLVEIVGTLQARLGTTVILVASTSGTYTVYGKCAGDTNLRFLPSSDFDGAIDTVSCVQINTEYRVFLTDANTGVATGCAFALNAAFEASLDAPYYQGETIYFSQLWSVFCADDGCYNVCISDYCTNGEFGELVANGNFSGDPALWTLGTGWAIAAGKACHTAAAGSGTISQVLATEAGKYYTIVLTVSSRTIGDLIVSLGGTLAGTISSNGTFTFTNVLATVDNATLSMTTSGPMDFDGCVDDVSVIMQLTSYSKDLCSDCYDLRHDHPCTRLLTWTNDNNGFGMVYTNFVNQSQLTHSFRTYCSFEKPKFPETMEDFEDSEGTASVQYFDSRTVYELFFDYLPLYLHKAIRVAKGHDHFYIDGVEYKCLKGDYIPEWRDRKKVAQSRIEITPKTEQNLNTLC